MQLGISVRCCFISGPRNQCHWTAASSLCHGALSCSWYEHCESVFLLPSIVWCGENTWFALWRRKQPCPFSSLAPSSPIKGKIKTKILVFPSENPIMKTCVYWPTIISKQLHLSCNQTKWPFCPSAQHHWKGPLFLWFNEETFCLVKQVFFQSCLLVSYRKIIVGSWYLLLFLFI